MAWQAAHRIRADLTGWSQLLGVQCQLVHGLEDLGDLAAACQVAATALAEYLAGQPGHQQIREYDDLSAALLRLARTLRLIRERPAHRRDGRRRCGRRCGDSAWKPASGQPLNYWANRASANEHLS